MNTEPSNVRSRLDPEPMPRRDFLGLSALLAAAAALLFAAGGILRMPKVSLSAAPSRKFRTRLPEALKVQEPFVPAGRSVAMFRDAEGVYAVSLTCTHLGCIVKSNADGFECPCHGSRFTRAGALVKGPAPTALPWFKVTRAGEDYIVDESAKVPAGTKV